MSRMMLMLIWKATAWSGLYSLKIVCTWNARCTYMIYWLPGIGVCVTPPSIVDDGSHGGWTTLLLKRCLYFPGALRSPDSDVQALAAPPALAADVNPPGVPALGGGSLAGQVPDRWAKEWADEKVKEWGSYCVGTSEQVLQQLSNWVSDGAHRCCTSVSQVRKRGSDGGMVWGSKRVVSECLAEEQAQHAQAWAYFCLRGETVHVFHRDENTEKYSRKDSPRNFIQTARRPAQCVALFFVDDK